MKRRSLTAEKIVEKALEFSDSEGFDALSMRKLAGLLNVTAMSLYNHVASKDALLELMLNRVAAEIESPDINRKWEDMMRRRAHSLRQVLLRHPWSSTLLISTISFGDAIMRDIDATVGCFVVNGFTHAQADWARNAIDSHVYGYTIQELNFPVEPDQYKAAATQFLPMISKADYPFVYDGALQVVQGEYDGMTDFAFGLELILDGLKAWLSTGQMNRPI